MEANKNYTVVAIAEFLKKHGCSKAAFRNWNNGGHSLFCDDGVRIDSPLDSSEMDFAWTPEDFRAKKDELRVIEGTSNVTGKPIYTMVQNKPDTICDLSGIV